jgi:hypothetical protein
MFKVNLLGLVAILAVSQISVEAYAQRDQPRLSLGTVTPLGTDLLCPSQGGHWGLLNQQGQAKCDEVTISCSPSGSSIPPATAWIKVMNPSGTRLGTIFTHAGAQGYQPWRPGDPTNTTDYLDDWVNANFQVVQVAWDVAGGDPKTDLVHSWENIGGANPTTQSIILAACRPATLMNYVYTQYHGGSGGAGAFCAMGDSAGASAVTLSMAFYGAGDYVDKLALYAGPPMADVAHGCQVIAGGTDGSITNCGTDPNWPLGGDPASIGCLPANNQFGCRTNVNFNFGRGANGLKVSYLGQTAMDVNSWIGGQTPDPNYSCRNDVLQTAPSCNLTPGTLLNTWQDRNNITNGTLAGLTSPIFTYLNTTITAYVCDVNENNHAGQANLYYLKFTSPNQVYSSVPKGQPFMINIVDGCDYPTMEDIGGQYEDQHHNNNNGQGWRTRIKGDPTYIGESTDGYYNSRDDMINNCVKNHP